MGILPVGQKPLLTELFRFDSLLGYLVKSNACKGFTLVELMVVLVIVGVLSAITVPRLSGPLGSITQKTAAKRVCAVLRYARSEAVSRGSVFEFSIDSNTGRVFVIEKMKSNFSAYDSPMDGVEKDISEIVFTLPGQITIDAGTLYSDRDENGLFCIKFYPNGRSSGGLLRISRDGSVSIFSINVSRVTGAVTVES